MAFMVYSLEVMHLFWTYYIVKTFFVANVYD